MSDTDRIEKKILLRASRARVWRALTDSKEFGSWFGMRLDDPFAPGATVRGAIVPTKVDPEVAKRQKDFEGKPVELIIEQIEPERIFSFRWHPGTPGADYSSEPTTLVIFELEEAPGGILVKVSESGFDKLPPARRAKAFASNDQGWGLVVGLLEKHLEQTA